MRRPTITLAVLVLCLGTAAAKIELARPAVELREPGRYNTVFWFDDMEGDVSQWWSVDLTTCLQYHFHVDTYMAWEGTYSWWCGTFDYDTDGGYGNGWDDRLLLPELDLSIATYPVLTFAYRRPSARACLWTWIGATTGYGPGGISASTVTSSSAATIP